jgi:dCTP deaminase
MGIKADRWIEKMALEQGMIEPFIKEQVREGVISYGLSSYGYDIRIADEFKVFTDVFGAVVDPKRFDQRAFVDIKEDTCIIPPNSFVLGRSVERIRMPRNVTGIVLCKSTYIRCGVLIPTTVLEAGWEGVITLEVANVTPLPARIYANEGVAQVLFFEGDEECRVSYADRRGKYQNQRGVVLPRV